MPFEKKARATEHAAPRSVVSVENHSSRYCRVRCFAGDLNLDPGFQDPLSLVKGAVMLQLVLPVVQVGASGSSCKCSGTRIPRYRNRSSSLPVFWSAVTVGRLTEDRSMLSDTLCDLYLFFFVPLSRRNDPMMTVLDTAALARISAEAQTVRYCWRP